MEKNVQKKTIFNEWKQFCKDFVLFKTTYIKNANNLIFSGS